jgi:AcrR family transcriptional regulator
VMRRTASADVNVTEILQEAGLSTRAFYRHFSSKEDLLRAMYRRETDRAAGYLVARLAAAPSALGKLEAWIDEHLSFVYDGRKAVRVALMSSEAAMRAADVVERQAMRELMLTPLIALLEQGRNDGTFPTAEPMEHALSIYAVVGGLVQAGATGTPVWPSRSRAVAETMRFCAVPLGVTADVMSGLSDSTARLR